LSSTNHVAQVLVVGAGIAGLAAAGAIRELGWDVSVVEQRPDFDETDEAQRRVLAGAAVWATAGDQPRLAVCRSVLVLVLLERGDLTGAGAVAAEVLAIVAGPLRGMPEDAGWLWAAMLLAEAEGRDQAALRLLGAIGAWSQRGHRWIEPLRRRYQPVTDRLLERTDPAVAAALMTEGAAMSPLELAARALASNG
jgi:hypothetical protein